MDLGLLPLRLAHVWFAGYFQPQEGQFGCVSCDLLGDAYQELVAQTFCNICAPNTKRYVGVLSASSRSTCQCKEGATSSASAYSMKAATIAAGAGHFAPNRKAGEVRSAFECEFALDD